MTSRIALSPWSRAEMGEAALVELETRATLLGCSVSTVKRTRAPARWVVRAFGPNHGQTVTVRAQGSLEVAIHGALDRYEKAWVYSAEELLQIARQSV